MRDFPLTIRVWANACLVFVAGVLLFATACRPASVNVYTIPRETEPPEHWRLAASVGPEKQRYLIRDQNGTATVSLTVLAGDGGGVLENVNRWRKQLNLEPLGQSNLVQAVETLPANDRNMKVMDANGTDFRDGSAARMVGVMAGDATLTWFYKLMGDPAIVERERAAFLKLAAEWR